MEPITVPVKEGPQEFEVFGILEDHLGVVSDTIEAEDRSPGYWLKFRTLSIVNHNKLEGFKLPARFEIGLNRFTLCGPMNSGSRRLAIHMV